MQVPPSKTEAFNNLGKGYHCLCRDTNAEILAKPSIDLDGLEEPEQRKLSKGEQRKLRQIAKQKEQKAQREQVCCACLRRLDISYKGGSNEWLY